MAPHRSVVNVGRIHTTARTRKIYDLCPSDVMLGGVLWISWPLFYRSHIEWRRLVDALRHVERSYPILCGRLERFEGDNLCVMLDHREENGFDVVKIRVPLTLCELRRSAGMVRCPEVGEAPCMNWPFFLEAFSDHPVLRDTGPLFGVHLVHAKDGCVLNVSIRHLLCDGTRYVQLLSDISRAYRGLGISERHLDRSFYWPDTYLQHFCLPDLAPDMYPRHMTLETPVFDEPGLCFACVHLPQLTIRRMKERTMDSLAGCDFVSTFDLAAALCWMFKAEVRSKTRPVTSKNLPIRGTSLEFPMDARTTDYPIVPENYFGNATLEAIVTFEGDTSSTKSFMDVLARAASLVRVTIDGIRHCPEKNFESLLNYYRRATAVTKILVPNLICLIASYHKMCFSAIDFGNGPPCHVYTTPTFPSQKLPCVTAPGSNGNGILLYLAVSSHDRQILDTSSVIKECVPGARVLPVDLKQKEAKQLLGYPSFRQWVRRQLPTKGLS